MAFIKGYKKLNIKYMQKNIAKISNLMRTGFDNKPGYDKKTKN